MATSYKTLWQEAQAENEQLQAKIRSLQRMNDRLAAALASDRGEHGRPPEIVDLAGIARRMRVGRHTPLQWRQRNYLPPVDYPEIKEPLWLASTIREKFAIPSGRFWYDTPDDEGGLSPAA